MTVFWTYPVHFLAYGLGTGLAPIAPGTVGSLLGVLLFKYMARLGTAAYTGVVLVMAVMGVFICGQTARDVGAMDPGMIVFDEIVGFLVAMYRLPARWPWIGSGFVIYRVFDIWKPWPIHAAEEWVGLGAGIMADDIIAGLYTLMILHAAYFVLRKKRLNDCG